jgi:ATP-dependent protease HslVU (ClpYQ) peptidase subunit
MGALHALYDERGLNAETLARRAVETAAEFDDATGQPVDSKNILLTSTRKRAR